MLHLPPLSEHIRVLNQEESERLDLIDPHLPKSLRDCVTCSGRKTFRWWADYGSRSEEIGDYECPCADQFVLHKYLLNAGIQKEYQRYAVGDIEDVDQEALGAITEYEENADFYVGQGRGFIFQGDRGTGKTLLSTILLKGLLDRGVDGYFTTFTDLLDNFAAGWKDDRLKKWFDARVRNAPLLVVDDIGKEHVNRVGMSSVTIDNIFRSRAQSGKPTIITTNLTSHELGRSYGSALENIAGTSKTFQFNGTSFRRNGKQAERNDKEMTLKLSRPITIA